MRADHERLHGIIKPIDDPFWSRYYPPLDWRCRCDVRATAADPTNDKEEDLPRVQFEGNVGKDKEIFTRKGTFFKLAGGNKNAAKNIEYSKLTAPYETVELENGTTVEVSIFADKSNILEHIENVNVAGAIKKTLKQNIKIRPHITVANYKNAEYLYKGKLGDRKSPEGKKLASLLAKGFEQKCEFIVFDLINYPYSVEKLLQKLKASFQKDEYYASIQQVYIVSKDRMQILHYYRSEIKKGVKI